MRKLINYFKSRKRFNKKLGYVIWEYENETKKRIENPEIQIAFLNKTLLGGNNKKIVFVD